jgi:UrcA family protein
MIRGINVISDMNLRCHNSVVKRRRAAMRRRPVMRTVFLAAIVLAASLSAAVAGPVSDIYLKGGTKNLRVSYADLDVASSRGGAALLQRIQVASRAVCGPTGYRMDLPAQERFETCLRETVRLAVARLNLPAVTIAFEHDRSPAKG